METWKLISVRAHTLQNSLEEARTLLEQADRARRMTEQELSDTNEQLSELTCQNQKLQMGMLSLTKSRGSVAILILSVMTYII